MNEDIGEQKTRVEADRKSPSSGKIPQIPDHQLLRKIGEGSYGEVWLARNVMGTYRAVKIVHRQRFEHERPFEREFEGIKKFEPVSRSHEGLVDVLQIGRNDDQGCFYYVMELADDANAECGIRNAESREAGAPAVPHSALRTRMRPKRSRMRCIAAAACRSRSVWSWGSR
jgi:serine/threonine protein kinase